MTPTTPSPISDQAAGDLLPCPFCGSEPKSDNGFSPCESIEYAWCSNQDCSLSTIEFGFTVEEWNRRAASSPKQESGPCQCCNGSGIDGGRMHTDERGASEYEPYRCELCDGFGRSTAPTTGSAPIAVRAFGTGAQVVIEGTFDGDHAVLICPAKQPGEVGASAKREGPLTDDSLIDAVVLTFPTAEQVERVANALVAASPAASVPKVTPKMIDAAAKWLTGLQHMRTTDKRGAIEQAITAALLGRR